MDYTDFVKLVLESISKSVILYNLKLTYKNRLTIMHMYGIIAFYV
jgi:hypothetical protein